MNHEFIKIILSATLGAIIAIVAASRANALAIRREQGRDRDQRKREFRAYLAELRSKIERLSGENTESDVRTLFSKYAEFVHQFHRERAKVYGDFLPRDEFMGLCETLGRMRHHEIASDPGGRNPRDVIAEAIDALIRFTDER